MIGVSSLTQKRLSLIIGGRLGASKNKLGLGLNMSIIRSTSNPEGMYIWNEGSGLKFTNLHGEKNATCEFSDFYNFVKEWYEGGIDDEHSFWSGNLQYEYRRSKKEFEYKSFLTVGDVTFEMWYVTWMCIVHNTLLNH